MRLAHPTPVRYKNSSLGIATIVSFISPKCSLGTAHLKLRMRGGLLWSLLWTAASNTNNADFKEDAIRTIPTGVQGSPQPICEASIVEVITNVWPDDLPHILRCAGEPCQRRLVHGSLELQSIQDREDLTKLPRYGDTLQAAQWYPTMSGVVIDNLRCQLQSSDVGIRGEDRK